MGLRRGIVVRSSHRHRILPVSGVCMRRVFSLRLSRRIVSVIDNLSYAAQRLGLGDFSVSILVGEQDQLGLLTASFITID